METYRYYSLPYCKEHSKIDEDEVEEELASMARMVRGDRLGGNKFRQRLGETVAGDHRETSPFEITFADNVS